MTNRFLIPVLVGATSVISGCENPAPLSPESDGGELSVATVPVVGAVAKLTASDGAPADQFGRSVSISGDLAIVGAPLDDDACPSSILCNSGSAYVFRRDGTTWSQEAKLTASDAAEFDQFGFSVSISGDLAIVGAFPGSSSRSASGSAYIFRRDGGTWSQEEKLTASDAAAVDLFGTSVSIDGDLAIVGANRDDDAGSASGSAYVYNLVICLARGGARGVPPTTSGPCNLPDVP